MRNALVASFICAAAALAQLGSTTWNGLQFGMSEDAAKRKLGKSFQFVPAGSVKGDFDLTPDYDLPLGGQLKLRFKPSMVFGSEGHLKTINLELDVPKTWGRKTEVELAMCRPSSV